MSDEKARKTKELILMVRILRRPDVVKRLSTDGGDVVAGTPEELAEHIRTETRSWAKVIREANIKAN